MNDIVKITSAADKHLTNLILDKKVKGVMLAVDGGGCAGLRYKWELIEEDKELEDRDKVNLDSGFLYIHPTATLSVMNTTIDYVTDIAGSSLRITNPNATSSCGCGESFAI
jgi:iron-sulfur cluster assembly accessory protein|tara:strand:- start:4562 stop:4894 length:333 start_codon:yes stop_codon:yes gene_type:complete